MCAGSSPLTRGKRRVPRRRILREGLIPAHAGKTDVLVAPFGNKGLIPAHAGKTSRRAARRFRCWAHPRSRGENGKAPAPCEVGAGSSPLTRGKRQPGVPVGNVLGLIPAHAGKTVTTATAPPPMRAHPRSRGENVIKAATAAKITGSSPLTRGKLYFLNALRATRGLIPAHAGKTYAL